MRCTFIELQNAQGTRFPSRVLRTRDVGPIEWTEGSLVVRVGTGYVPLASVVYMEPDKERAPVECDSCGESFDDPRALGGHRRHCKGRVQ